MQKSAKFYSLTLPAIVFLGLLSAACGRSAERQSEAASAVEREALYRELAMLEQSVTSPLTDAWLDPDTATSMDWVRAPGVRSPAEDELARSRRNLALEQLAAQTAPVSTASDYEAFWEIHQAYRFAVETGRPGYGEQSLVYSRPYPGDHLSGPLALLLSLTAEGRPAPASSLPPAETLRQDILRQSRRLDIELTAGNALPLPIARRMRRDIAAGAFADREALAAARERLSAESADIEVAPFDVTVRDYLSRDMLNAVQGLDRTLETIETAWAGDVPPATYSTAFHNELIAQAGLPEVPANVCEKRAEELILTTDEDLLALLGAAFPNPEISLARLNRLASDWQVSAPLFLPHPDDVAADEENAPAEAATDQNAPPADYHTEDFLTLRAAWEQLTPDWQMLFSHPIETVALQEANIPVPPVMSRYYQPPPAQAKPVSTARLRQFAQGADVVIPSAALTETPTEFAIIDLLMAYQPGTGILRQMQDHREDVPELSRQLPDPAFDLGWPYFVLEQISNRGALELAPRIEFARLYRLKQMLIEARLDAAFAQGELSYDEAVNELQNGLSISAEQARDIADRLIVEPGLGCATFTGYTHLRGLESRAKGVLGARFNVRQFNDVLLEQGSRPLNLAEADIDAWISASIGRYDPNATDH